MAKFIASRSTLKFEKHFICLNIFASVLAQVHKGFKLPGQIRIDMSNVTVWAFFFLSLDQLQLEMQSICWQWV